MKHSLAISLFIGLFCLSACDKDEVSSVQKTSFVKYYTNFPVLSGADVTPTSEGYAILGTARTNNNKTLICLIRTDEFGNSLDSARTYALHENNTAYCLKTLDDGGFGILGSSLNPANGKRLAWFIRTNNVGDTLWTRQISGAGNLEAKYFEVNSQESFFMTGYADEAGKGREIWWFAIDNEGRDIRNQRTFGLFGSDDEGNHLQFLSNGSLVITGYVTRSGIRRPIIIKTDENTVYSNVFELESALDETGVCIRVLDAENFLILGNHTESTGSEISLRQIYMPPGIKPVIQWETFNSVADHDESSSLIVDDQELYILGSTGNSSNSAITIITMDLEGNEINNSQFGEGSRLSGISFKRTTDNGFIIVGTNAHPEQNNTALVLIKTDSDAGL